MIRQICAPALCRVEFAEPHMSPRDWHVALTSGLLHEQRRKKSKSRSSRRKSPTQWHDGEVFAPELAGDCDFLPQCPPSPGVDVMGSCRGVVAHLGERRNSP